MKIKLFDRTDLFDSHINLYSDVCKTSGGVTVWGCKYSNLILIRLQYLLQETNRACRMRTRAFLDPWQSQSKYNTEQIYNVPPAWTYVLVPRKSIVNLCLVISIKKIVLCNSNHLRWFFVFFLSFPNFTWNNRHTLVIVVL